MNTLLRLLLAALLLLGVSSATALAQAEGRVTTGVIEKISPETGVMTVRSQQTHRPLTFYGVDKAMLVHTLGKQPMITDLAPGMQVTIRYAARGKQWFVDKITYGEAAPGPGTLTGNSAVTNTTGTTAPAIPPTLNTQKPVSGEIVPEQNTRGGSVGRNRGGGNAPGGANLLQ
jgi:hypothetical protein